MSDMVEVVSAIIVRDGRLLLTQRRADKDFPLTWECPGGKVDDGESHHQALGREVLEELGIATAAISNTPVWSGRFDNLVSRPDRASIFLLFYWVAAFEGNPLPREGQGIGWFVEAEVRALALTPGNARAIGDVCRAAFGKTRARLDADRTAEPKTKLVAHVKDDGHCFVGSHHGVERYELRDNEEKKP